MILIWNDRIRWKTNHEPDMQFWFAQQMVPEPFFKVKWPRSDHIFGVKWSRKIHIFGTRHCLISSSHFNSVTSLNNFTTQTLTASLATWRGNLELLSYQKYQAGRGARHPEAEAGQVWAAAVGVHQSAHCPSDLERGHRQTDRERKF